MKKQFLNLGKALSKTEQKQISGGKVITEFCDGTITNECESDDVCGNITDPLSGAHAAGYCRMTACGTRCYWTLD